MAVIDRVFAMASLIAAVFLVAMLNLTTPSDVGPLGVLVFFTLMYVVCLGAGVVLCRVWLFVKGGMQKNGMRDNRKKSYYFGSVLAYFPIILVFMRSLGKLNVLEIALSILFVVVGCFYVSKKA